MEHPLLLQFIRNIPYIHSVLEVFDPKLSVGISNRKQYIYFKNGKGANFNRKAGDILPENSLQASVIAEKRTLTVRRSSTHNNHGFAYFGICAPIYDDSNSSSEIIGSLLLTFSIEKEEYMKRISKHLIDFINDVTVGDNIIKDSTEGIKKHNENVDLFMRRTQQDLNKTKDITSFIDNINSKTNLLGLNAGIEASRVGTVGNGFNVIANEIRNLSYDSSISSKEIHGILNNINEGIMHFNELLESSKQLSEKQIDEINSLNKYLTELESLALEIPQFIRDY